MDLETTHTHTHTQGWGTEYQRKRITTTPCWIQMHIRETLIKLRAWYSIQQHPSMRMSSPLVKILYLWKEIERERERGGRERVMLCI